MQKIPENTFLINKRGKFCPNCGKYSVRHQSDKCIFCNKSWTNMERCLECKGLLGPQWNYCELCGSQTRRFKRIQRAKELSLRAKRRKLAEPQNAGRSKSPDIFEEFDITYSDICLIEKTLNVSESASEMSTNETVILTEEQKKSDAEEVLFCIIPTGCKGTRADEIKACLKKSVLCPSVKVFSGKFADL